jgi:glycine betaine/proline transport system ATP-binding protein
MSAEAPVELQNVDILFTREGGRAGANLTAQALKALDAGESRAQISERLGVVVGVADASLTVERGELCVLMGLSGSGKSTLLRSVNGLNRVARGHVLIRDRSGTVDVTSCDDASLRRVRRESIAMVFQQFGLLPWRTVSDNVGLGLELRGEPPEQRRRIVAEKLELVGLAQWADRHVSELSGGMQQRVGLARAFATDADILLMDEPFSALDPLIRTRLQDELCMLQERFRKTILFVTHDMDEALKLGDRIAVLEGGRIIQTGAAQDILLRPVNDHVAQFVRHVNPLSVLTGAMVMRHCSELVRSENAVWLDVARRYQILLNERGEVDALRIDGEVRPLVAVGDDPPTLLLKAGVVTAPPSVSLHDLIRLREATGHPVLLVEEGRLAGVCGESEILQALVRGRHAAAPGEGVIDGAPTHVSAAN